MLVALPAVVRASDPLFDEDAEGTAAAGPWDPIEPVNRKLFDFNQTVDEWLFDPLVRAYDFTVPAPARRAIRRALLNLDSPAIFVNDVLQGSPIEAMTTVTRFGFNSTIGLLGLFDAADAIGLPGHRTDFGDTLALAGVPSGPYLILPFVGPTTARDAGGYAVDFLFRPTTYFLPPVSVLIWAGVTEGSSGIATRDAHAEALEALEASAVDYYATLRSAWWQNAQAEVQARRDAPLRLVNLLPELTAGTLGAPRREIVDLPAQRGDERLEAVALQH